MTMQMFLERRLPLAVSVFLHAALLLLLFLQRIEIPTIKSQRMKPIQMHVLMPPEPALSPASDASQPPVPSEVQQTTPNRSEEPSPDAAAAPDSDTQEEQPAVAEPPPVLPTVSEKKIATVDEQTLKEWKARLKDLEALQKARKSQVTGAAARADIASKGVKRSYVSRGAKKGVIREIDIEGFPKHLQQRFMRRYGIKVVRKFVKDGSGSSYLNAVKTDDGAYLNRTGPGYGDVMVLSRNVLARMAELEESELLKRGLDPLRTRLREVVFGLEQDDRGMVDLIITRFRAEPIE